MNSHYDAKALRGYFEEGCLCVRDGLIDARNDSDEKAATFYMRWCVCSRHPEHGSPSYQKEVPREV